jgi:hypothetical protein
MSRTYLEPMTEEELYGIEFDYYDRHEEPEVEEPFVAPTCPACGSEDLRFAMHYAAPDRETGYDDSGECFSCTRCGAIGDAEECASIGPFPAPAAIGVHSETRPAAALPEVA